MKVLSPAAHGILDYLTVAFFAAAPSLFNLQGTYATVCYVLAVGYLLITLLTNFPLGLMRVIPFPVHGKLELVSGLALLVSPFLFGFADDNVTARNLFMGAGVVFLIVYFLTDWRAQTHTATTHNTGAALPH
ncbi:SPW repeat domain-containing protein [Hymenobacter sp. 102]|uniref:SPW repeat domain-containing protein n=1 Tax=Hymenobacter sp. 102 TaxID=3403152 RepID=UPI003CE75C7F